jgi:hypothetical protein
MDHTPAESIQWEDAGDQHFTGRVRFGPLSRVPDPGLNALGVLFVSTSPPVPARSRRTTVRRYGYLPAMLSTPRRAKPTGTAPPRTAT